ncbi:MAG: M56 family metallopeptidase [Bacteroidota bacterium]|nr:M56 family metallopeptidase [Bacteroidota bacterium]
MDLNAFQHSLFLSALGNAILNSLWQAFLLWLLYQTVIISYKKPNSRFKHNLSVVFIFCSFIWFITTFILKSQANQKVISFVSQTNNFGIPENGKSSFFNFFPSLIAQILPYFSIAYIFLLFFLAAKLYLAYKYVHFISNKNLIKPPFNLETFASKVALQSGISKKIKIWISSHIEIPATIGFIKPVILIPFASINNLTVLQLEAIILHELSHIKRNDYLTNLLLSIIETVLFFNPFVAIFIKIIKRERENCCDDFVLQYRYDPYSYASALLRLEQSRKSNIQLALGAVSGKKQLLSRIKRITGTHTETQFNYGQKLLALLITTGIFCSIAWLSPSEIKKEEKLLPSKTNNEISQNRQTETIQKNINPKSKNDLQKINPQPEIKPSEIEKQEVISKEKNNDNVDNNFSGEFSSISKNALASLNSAKLHIKIPKLQIENFNLNDEINKGIGQAFKEINKINWKKIQNNIDKSLSEINLEKLSATQKAEIIKAKKYISLINLSKQFNASKIIKEIQKQKKLMADSLQAAGVTLSNQQPARLAENVTESKGQSPANSSKIYYQEPENGAYKRNASNPKNDLSGDVDRKKIQIKTHITISHNQDSNLL